MECFLSILIRYRRVYGMVVFSKFFLYESVYMQEEEEEKKKSKRQHKRSLN